MVIGHFYYCDVSDTFTHTIPSKWIKNIFITFKNVAGLPVFTFKFFWLSIDAQLEIIRQHLSSLSNNTIGDKVFHGLMVEHLSTPNTVSILIWVCVIILGIVLITAAALGYRSYILSSKVAVHQRQYKVALVAPSAPMNPVDRHGLRGLNFWNTQRSQSTVKLSPMWFM